MTSPESSNGTSRDELVQRLALMEQMIAEGRHYTGRNSWIFVLWGVVDLVAIGWQRFFPHSGGPWAWPVCLSAGVILTIAGKMLQRGRDGYSRNDQCSRVTSVWGMMGVAMGIYIAAAMFTHFDWQYSYMAALLMMIGLAHAISAMILRWPVQGLAAVVYWAGGVAILACNSRFATNVIWIIEMGVVMMAFGLYAMRVEPTGSGMKGACA